MYSSNLSKGNNSLSECDELDLVERIRKGNQEAFRSLVLYYEPRLLAHLLPMLGNIENARDILQETFLVVFQELPTWKRGLTGTSGHPLAPWIYRIATNKALSLLRKQSVRAKYGHEQASAGGRCNARNEMPFPLQEHMSIEERYVTRELLRLALLRLGTDDAICLIAHFVEGERYAEIATRLGLSSEAVRKRIQRALVALRKTYQELGLEAQ